VAVVLRHIERLEVLLMQRTVRAGDRWSGHVSLPGGGEEPTDVDLRATAIRETREEVGIDLTTSGDLLGQLAPAWAVARGVPLPMSITPFVFALARPVEIALGSEATSAFWLPVDAAASGALSAVYPHRLGPFTWKLPCWRYQDQTVWGLTFEMLRNLLVVVR
jgi:8-oxo-dGTP pyrophosphatase MutT (NUDIX family)